MILLRIADIFVFNGNEPMIYSAVWWQEINKLLNLYTKSSSKSLSDVQTDGSVQWMMKVQFVKWVCIKNLGNSLLRSIRTPLSVHNRMTNSDRSFFKIITFSFLVLLFKIGTFVHFLKLSRVPILKIWNSLRFLLCHSLAARSFENLFVQRSVCIFGATYKRACSFVSTG